jgi:truncated hemoglobin YjbI
MVMTSDPRPLYDRLGGKPAIDAATEIFYRKVLADPVLSPYFDGVDMERQVAKQAAFLTMALGGPNHYTGKDLRTAHAHLPGLRDEHVDKVIGHLAQTLRELGVAEPDINAAGAVATSVRDEVLGR